MAEQTIQFIYENWKSTLAGLGVVFAGVAFLMKIITLQEFVAVLCLAAGGGFVVAADAKKGSGDGTGK